MNKFQPQNFNDFLALILISLISGLWVLQGIKIITLLDSVNGALVVLFTLIVQFYFRRAPIAPDITTTTSTTTSSTPTTETPK